MQTITKVLKSNCVLSLIFVLFFSFSLQAQTTRAQKLQNLLDTINAYEIVAPKIVLAQAAFETGWLECKNCTYIYNNLFGFRNNKGYIRFKTQSDCIAYLKTWQETYYKPWKELHPGKNYYDFLVHMHYARNMQAYIQKVKVIKALVAKCMKEEEQQEEAK